MRGRGFLRFIKNGQGQWFKLPHAEYNRVGSVTSKQVLNEAIAAAEAAAPTFKRKIVVTEAEKRSWDGLERVTPEAVTRG